MNRKRYVLGHNRGGGRNRFGSIHKAVGGNALGQHRPALRRASLLSVGAGQIDIGAPSDPNRAPPGYRPLPADRQ